MKQTCSLVLVLVLYASDVFAQPGIAWNASPDPTVTAYAPSVDGKPLGQTSALYVPWTPSAAYHRICVESVAGTLTGLPACIDYGTPPNQPPVVSMTFPTTGSTVIAPAAFVLKADAVDPDGTITCVEFIGGAMAPIGSDCTAPYEVSHGVTLPGPYGYRAKATDNSGASTTSLEVVLNALAPPPPPPPARPCAARTGEVKVGETYAVKETTTTANLAKRVAELLEAGWTVVGFTGSATVLAVCQ